MLGKMLLKIRSLSPFYLAQNHLMSEAQPNSLRVLLTGRVEGRPLTHCVGAIRGKMYIADGRKLAPVLLY